MSYCKATKWEDVEELLCKHEKTDEELEKILPWFYENVKCFNQVKEEPVKQILRKSDYAPVRKDHVVIRQGEVGDCCYVILRGSVSVYTRRIEDNEYSIPDEPSVRTTIVKNFKDRSKFGAEVSLLRSGDKFGDLCFYKENSERNATVIADDNLDLLVIDKKVYEKYLHEKFIDMKDQLHFMVTSPLFKGYPFDYRVSLLEKMRAKRMNYGSGIVRQGDHVKNIFIICRGEALLKVNPAKLGRQYHLQESDGTFINQRPLAVIQRRRKIRKHGYVAGENLIKQRNVTIATVGPNQLIGDVEFMMNLSTHHVTAVCNSSMLIMTIEVTELHRIILRRDAGISNFINSSVLCKLNGRANRCTNVPQYQSLYEMAEKTLMLKKAPAQSKTRSEGARKSTLVKIANMVKLGTKLGDMVKNTTKPQLGERTGSIVSALTKTAAVAAEVGAGSKVISAITEAAKRQENVTAETTCQDDVTETRITKARGKTRKEVPVQDKGKKQLTAKEYRVLKKKMQAAGKTIRPLD